MALAQLDITLVITNNKPYPQEVSVMGNPSNLLDTSNATTEYRWDITGFSITNENTVSIQYRGTGTTTPFNIFVADLAGNNNQSIVDALNLLGIGFFYIYDELGLTYLSTYNQTTEFGTFDIYYVAPPSSEPVNAIAAQSGLTLLTQSGEILETQ